MSNDNHNNLIIRKSITILETKYIPYTLVVTYKTFIKDVNNF